MNIQDLIVGKKYCTKSARRVVSLLEGIDEQGDPVLRGLTPHTFITYGIRHEQDDPACKVGTYGHTMVHFLETYEEYKED